jgi:hypothetical protein
LFFLTSHFETKSDKGPPRQWQPQNSPPFKPGKEKETSPKWSGACEMYDWCSAWMKNDQDFQWPARKTDRDLPHVKMHTANFTAGKVPDALLRVYNPDCLVRIEWDGPEAKSWSLNFCMVSEILSEWSVYSENSERLMIGP